MKKYNWVAQSAHGAIVLSVSKPKVVTQIDSWVYDTNDFVIIGIQRINPTWDKTLIDLSKNDYIIKDGILMATRKHAALIHAWADGAIIQYQNSDGKWADVVRNDPSWRDDETYRIKPETVKFRNYIINGQVRAYNQGSSMPNPDEYKWIDKDWQEVEV